MNGSDVAFGPTDFYLLATLDRAWLDTLDVWQLADLTQQARRGLEMEVAQ